MPGHAGVRELGIQSRYLGTSVIAARYAVPMNNREIRSWKQQDGPCAGCGKEGGNLALSGTNRLTGKHEWWHLECLSPEKQAWLLQDDEDVN